MSAARVWVAAAIVLGSAWPVRAQEPAPSQPGPTIEQLVEMEVESVVGASKYEQAVTRAPASVSIVTSAEIRKYGYRTLADALRSLAGLFVSDDRNYEYVGMRGFARPGDYNSRLLLLVDGHRVNENLYDSFYVGMDSIVAMELIDRIEVIRGPSSSIYGNSAFLGVINVITKRGRHVDGAELSADAGSFDAYGGRATYGRQFANDVDVLLSGSVLASAGQRALYYAEFDPRVSAEPRASNDGIARDADGERSRSVFGRVSRHGLAVSGALVARRKDIPTASFETIFNDGREHTVDARGYVDVAYEHVASEDLRILGRVFYDHYRYKGDYPYDADSPPGSVINRDDAAGRWLGAEIQATRRVAGRHTLVFGAEYRANLRQDQFNFDVAPRTDYLDARHSSQHASAFVLVEAALRPDLIVNAGLRYDRYSAFGGTASPRVALIFAPRQGAALKLLYGRAFRAPNEFELHYGSEGTAEANPFLRPETIHTYEIAFEHTLPARQRMTISAYRYDIADLVSQTEAPDTGAIRYDNISQVWAAGAEAALAGRYRFGIEARASVAVQRARSMGTDLSNSPRTLGTLQLGLPLGDERWFGGIEVRRHGSMRTLAADTTPAFTVVHATITRRAAHKGFDVSLSLRNMLNARYGYPGAADHLQDRIEQDGRTVRLVLVRRF